MIRVRNVYSRWEWMRIGLFAFAAGLACFSIFAGQQGTTIKSNSRPAEVTDPHLQEAGKLLNQGRVGEAKQAILEQLQQNPKSVEGYNLLGVLYIGEKDYEKAQDAFQHALTVDARSVRTRNNLANMYVAEGRLDRAEKEFRESLRIEPTNSDANYNLGVVLLAQNNPSAAIQHFLLVKPASKESRFNLTRAYLRTGRMTQALKVANELSSQEPKERIPLAVRQIHSFLRAHRLVTAAD